MDTNLRSAAKTITIGPNRPTVLIGERINPTGKKRLAAALGAGELDVVEAEALEQVEAGADVLDVNVGAAGVDETDMLPKAVRLVMETVDVPVCIDTANAEALRRALEVHRELAPAGVPLVNSVNGEAERLDAVLPLVAEFGAAVIGLTMDDEGIPDTAARRLEIAHTIAERAAAVGIGRDRLVIDCLALTVGADTNAGLVTLDAIRGVQAELGVNMTLGASNISFGLPAREQVVWAFLAMAIQAGVNCPIVDAAKVRGAILAADLVLGRDDYAMRYIKYQRSLAKRGKAT